MKKKLSGWQRLWILTSLIYLFVVVGFAYIIYEPPSEEKIDNQMRDLKSSLNQNIFNFFDQEAMILKEYDISAFQEKDKWILKLNGGERIVLGNNFTPDTIVEKLGEYLKLQYEKDKKNFLFKYVAKACAFWVIPVIVIYILGFSVGWVIRGFRK